MTTTRRLLNLKVIAIVAMVLFVAACYFAARKVMVSDIELGMDQQTVLETLGQPTQQWNTSLDGMSETFLWESVCVSENAYRRSTVIKIRKTGGVVRIDVCHTVLGRSYVSTRP